MAVAMSAKATAGAVPAFDRMVVLGDSLSDSGNAGRFSNGPVWVEVLAGRLGLDLRPSQEGGSNYAVGGARLGSPADGSSLRRQADLFLGKAPPAGRTLHVVYGGGNDVLAALGHPGGPAELEQAAGSLRDILADLIAAGASDLLVPNLPDIGMTPGVRAHGDDTVALAGRLTRQFNAAADRAIDGFARAGSRSVRLHRLDIHAMADQLRSDPGAFGFTDIRTPCSNLPGCAGYLFWDQVHPTADAHRQLAQAALRALVVARQAVGRRFG
jgi:phospholipase/lecithinase/hemolysin